MPQVSALRSSGERESTPEGCPLTSAHMCCGKCVPHCTHTCKKWTSSRLAPGFQASPTKSVLWESGDIQTSMKLGVAAKAFTPLCLRG